MQTTCGRCADDMHTTWGRHENETSGEISLENDRPHVVCTTALHKAYWLPCYFVVQLRVWARPDAVDAGQVDYALDIGVRILTYFEDYFNIPYPLPKLGIYYIQNQLARRHVFRL